MVNDQIADAAFVSRSLRPGNSHAAPVALMFAGANVFVERKPVFGHFLA
jgi:hypothetical protein